MAPQDEGRLSRAKAGLGTEPGRHAVALLLVDVINPLDFPGSAPLVRRALPMARRLARLAERFRNERLPVIYVNDNFGRWESDWRKVIRHCTSQGMPGRRLSATLRPHRGDYFVLKPKHSGFFSTTLDVLSATSESARSCSPEWRRTSASSPPRRTTSAAPRWPFIGDLERVALMKTVLPSEKLEFLIAVGADAVAAQLAAAANADQ